MKTVLDYLPDNLLLDVANESFWQLDICYNQLDYKDSRIEALNRQIIDDSNALLARDAEIRVLEHCLEAKAKRKPPPLKRKGPVTKSEKALVAQVVLDQPGPVNERQERALATSLRRSKEVIHDLVLEAKENFVALGPRYVEIHMAAAEKALASGSLGIATEAAEWALEHIAADGSRVIEPAVTGPTGNQILIGIQMGGVKNAPASVAIPAMSVTGVAD